MSTMTQKHFELIAKVLRDQRPDGTLEVERENYDRMVEGFAEALKPTNVKFDEWTFRAAALHFGDQEKRRKVLAALGEEDADESDS